MHDRRLTDAQISAALRAHLPTVAPGWARRALLDAVASTAQERSRLPFLPWPTTLPPALRSNRALVVVLLLAALLAGLAAAGAAWRLMAPHRLGNGWIAYSTDGPVAGATDRTTGSDLYLVREGGAPILVAGRDGGSTRNACPSFSPDGTKLAYATSAGDAIIVRGVSATGLTLEERRLVPPHPIWPMCVRWLADGSHLAYPDGSGGEVVLGLDGSLLAHTAVSSVPAEWVRPDPLAGVRSPSGEWTVRVTALDGPPCDLVITRRDGTDVHSIRLSFCPYALAGWSPDGTRVLLMEDVSGIDFTMHAVELDTGVQSVVVSSVRTNGTRSWAGWGDVSWQPVLP